MLLAINGAVLAAGWLMARQSAHLSRVQCFRLLFLFFWLLRCCCVWDPLRDSLVQLQLTVRRFVFVLVAELDVYCLGVCFRCVNCVAKVTQECITFPAQPLHYVRVAQVLPVQEVCCRNPDGMC